MRFGLSLAFVALLLGASSRIEAQTIDGPGLRAQGMAGAFVAVADDASAIFWNPAGLATAATFDAQIGVEGLQAPGDPVDAHLAFAGAAMPALGVGYYKTRVLGSVTAPLPTVSSSADRQNGGSGEVQLSALTTRNFGVAVLQTIVNGLVVGSTVRLVSGQMSRDSGRTTVDVDAGVMVSAGSMRVGLTARNLRQPGFPGDVDRIGLKRQVKAGVALVPRSLPTGVHGPFSLAFDVDLKRTPSAGAPKREAAVGAEYWAAGGRLGARAGTRWSTTQDRSLSFSAGLTVGLPHSLFVEGQLTKPRRGRDSNWGIGARVTF